ncbi:hypothetical protein PF008_g11996 [Phytophthora fragariae]|uniref:Uncharacterized protein n=1 Tax=Phytophthora fragariae TaxID=53985 RepID=A0A6G0RQN5_9STRA|nr:hypothetical protein PF008_g11996 [Phytophthora fragariae]
MEKWLDSSPKDHNKIENLKAKVKETNWARTSAAMSDWS